MGTAFGWLADLLGTFGSLIPQYHHLECVDIGVSITRGSRVKILKPGIIWYWPFWTSIYYSPANVQTVSLPTQALLTRDEKRVVAGGMVRYTLVDAEKALVDTDDVDQAIVDEALAVICEYITSKTVGDIQKNRTQTNTELTRSVRKGLNQYGVQTGRAQLTDFSPCITLNHVGMPPTVTGENLEGE